MNIKKITLLVSLALYSSCGFSNNQRPEILNLSVTADKENKQVIIQYDVMDIDNQEVFVSLKVSSDAGSSFLVDTYSATGDIGKGIPVGNEKKIVWRYPSYIYDIESYIVKLIVDDLEQIDINELIVKVDSSRLVRNLQSIYGERNYSSRDNKNFTESVHKKIYRLFESKDLEVFFWEFEHNGNLGKNCVGKIRGVEEEISTYILGAHFDTIEGSKGADDNASGVVGLMEAVEILSDYSFSKTIDFIAFDMEEEGLVGSFQYLPEGIEDYERVEGMFNLDMIGYFDDELGSQQFPSNLKNMFPGAYTKISEDGFRGNFLLSIADGNSEKLSTDFVNISQEYVPGLPIISLVVTPGKMLPIFQASDHANFWKHGYPALSLGDGADTRNPHYNSSSDTIETIDFGSMKKVVQAIIATLAELAEIKHSTFKVTKIQVENG